MGTPELPDKPAASRSSVFLRRAMSTLILWALVAGALAFESQLLFSVVIVAIGTLALLEFLGLLELEATPGWHACSGADQRCDPTQAVQVAGTQCESSRAVAGV